MKPRRIGLIDILIIISIMLLVVGIIDKKPTLNFVCFMILITGIIIKLIKRDKNRKSIRRINQKEIEDDYKQVIQNIDELKKNITQEVTGQEKVNTNNVINTSYKLPSVDLLNKPKNMEVDNGIIETNISKIETTLKSFGIIAKVIEVHIGPIISQYEIEVASGTKVNKIATLDREIALALAKKDVKISSIPGKSTVGIEFANDNQQIVSFYELMDSKVMKEAPEKSLMVPLGKSFIGDIVVCEINKLPHLLIAGTTGSGKSVCLNSFICSILMRAKPDEVKLALIDTKRIEFMCYNGVPHLLCSVVTNPNEASILLKKIHNEVEKRCHMFENVGVRQIEGYNEYVKKYNEEHPEEMQDKMPYIVVIIDDLLDLLMISTKNIEDSILRITQNARAAGVHLIISTQRPSREVLTETIKTCIPSRISFVVSSKNDSNIILDQEGAELLSGKGDMLYLPIGMKKPIEIQGTFIRDNEIEKIVNFVRGQQENLYDSSFAQQENKSISKISSDDALYNEIVDFVVKTGKASASLLQRKFKIGYNKAATMIDELEENGIIGPATGNSKPREVLVKYSNSNDE